MCVCVHEHVLSLSVSVCTHLYAHTHAHTHTHIHLTHFSLGLNFLLFLVFFGTRVHAAHRYRGIYAHAPQHADAGAR